MSKAQLFDGLYRSESRAFRACTSLNLTNNFQNMSSTVFKYNDIKKKEKGESRQLEIETLEAKKKHWLAYITMIQIVQNIQDALRFYASEKEPTQTWVLSEVFCIIKRRKKTSKDRINQGKDKSREYGLQG